MNKTILFSVLLLFSSLLSGQNSKKNYELGQGLTQFGVFLRIFGVIELKIQAGTEPKEIPGGRLTSCLEFRASQKVYPALAESWLSFG